MTGLAWSPAWAASAWFVPFANLAVPFAIARDLWSFRLPPIVVIASLEGEAANAAAAPLGIAGILAITRRQEAAAAELAAAAAA